MFCTACCLPEAVVVVAAAAALAPVTGTAPAASSEHSFLTAGCCNAVAASSSGLFLGLPSLDAACLRGEGLARRERLRLGSRAAFFDGLAPRPGDLGDIWTLPSSEPRTRRLVGVAVALILGVWRLGVFAGTRLWEVGSPQRDGLVQRERWAPGEGTGVTRRVGRGTRSKKKRQCVDGWRRRCSS